MNFRRPTVNGLDVSAGAFAVLLVLLVSLR